LAKIERVKKRRKEELTNTHVVITIKMSGKKQEHGFI